MKKKSLLKPSQIIEHLDMPGLRAAAVSLIADGHSQAEVIQEVVALIDAAIPWEIIIPGPIGIVVEAMDGPVAIFLATSIVRVASAMHHKKPAASTLIAPK